MQVANHLKSIPYSYVYCLQCAAQSGDSQCDPQWFQISYDEAVDQCKQKAADAWNRRTNRNITVNQHGNNCKQYETIQNLIIDNRWDSKS